jgi:hypothetical protein
MASKKVGKTIEAALKDLFDERAVVDDAINKLQKLLHSVRPGNAPVAEPKRRGRPPKSASKVPVGPKVAGRKPGRPAKVVTAATATAANDEGAAAPRSSWSAAARKKAADRMRNYWADQRKQKAQSSKAQSKRRSRA